MTGCDSGMGECTAFHLAKTGYHVFAGCFLPDSKKKYDENPNITYVQIDVTNEESVDAAQKFVESEVRPGEFYGAFSCFLNFSILDQEPQAWRLVWRLAVCWSCLHGSF